MATNDPPPPPTTPPRATDAHEVHVRQLAAIAELLLGAAWADGKAVWAERSAIAAALTGFIGSTDLPDEVSARIQAFDPAKFELEAACKALHVPTPSDRRHLLELIARVTDADAALMPGESTYLRRVATAIGATDAELEPFIASD